VQQPLKEKYPFLDTSEYLRLQTGKLYAKIMAEMDAGTHAADVLTISEISMAQDFQSKQHWMLYASPSYTGYDAKFLSKPAGYWGTWRVLIFGIAYNTDVVKPEEAPKTWKDLLDPKWKGQINFKDSASGGQYNQWHMLRKLYGDEYWQKMMENKPIGLAASTQQWEKLINREHKLIGLAQGGYYANNKKKGAPVAIVFPKEGVPSIGEFAGVVQTAPHPECAKLFIDYLFSLEGQTKMVDIMQESSAHPKAPTVAAIPPLSELNLYVPDDWDEYYKTNATWGDIWNKIVGM
jgi:iron(III) transport system substrate-binding protein